MKLGLNKKTREKRKGRRKWGGREKGEKTITEKRGRRRVEIVVVFLFF